MQSFGGERPGRGLSRVFGARARRPSAMALRAPGEFYEVLIQVLHLRQDEFGLRPVQFPDVQGDYLPAPVREHGEREYRRIQPKGGAASRASLFADEAGDSRF